MNDVVAVVLVLVASSLASVALAVDAALTAVAAAEVVVLALAEETELASPLEATELLPLDDPVAVAVAVAELLDKSD